MRRPAVAGSFYAGSAAELGRQIEGCFKHPLGPGGLPAASPGGARHTLGLVSPHAGYVYSGPVASHGFFRIASEDRPHTIVILGPNHRGLGAAVALSREDRWQTPLGEVVLDREVGEAIASESKWAEWDDAAHTWEHSVEVQLPFLQYVYEAGVRLVLITMVRQDLQVSQDLGAAIATALRGREGLVIASSDFSHYERQSTASRKDQLAIDAILGLDPGRLEKVVEDHDITMCGPGPVMTMMVACTQLGASQARLLRYATSGDVSGDYSQVVGYASVALSTASF